MDKFKLLAMENQDKALAGDNRQKQHIERPNQDGNEGHAGLIPDEQMIGSDADIDRGGRSSDQGRDRHAGTGDEPKADDKEYGSDNEDLKADESRGGTAV